MGNEASTEEPKKTSAFMKKMRGIAASAVGLFASSTGLANTTDVESHVEDNNPSVYEFTEASEEISRGRKTYNIETTRSISDDSYGNVAVLTNTSEEEQKGRTETSRRETVKEDYSLSSGYTKKTDIKNTKQKSRKSGVGKSYVTETSTSLYNESGAVAHAMGNEFVAESSNRSLEKGRFDKQGRFKKVEVHSEINSCDVGLKRDDVIKYNYNEEMGEELGIGDSEKYGVKKSFSVEANVKSGNGNVTIYATEKDKLFSANISSSGNEFYTTEEGNRSIRIEVIDGVESGVEYGLESEIGRGVLSRKELKKELKLARMKANNVIRKATRGEITSVGEYFASVKQANVEGTMPKLGDYFNRRIDDSKIAKETEEFKPVHEARVATAKSVTAQDIVNQKLAER